MAITYSVHAEERIVARQVSKVWIERVITTQDWTRVDPENPMVMFSFGAVPERDDRILQVVHSDRHVITAYFNRRAKR